MTFSIEEFQNLSSMQKYDIYFEKEKEIRNLQDEIESFRIKTKSLERHVTWLERHYSSAYEVSVLHVKRLSRNLYKIENYYAEIIRLRKETTSLHDKLKNNYELIKELKIKSDKEENIKFDMACEIEQLKTHLTHSQQFNENQANEILKLKKEIKEKQLIIDARKFAGFKPIYNNRVGMTTPIKKADENKWTILDGSDFSYPPLDKIIEVKPEGSQYPGKLMKWSNVNYVWHSLDGSNERDSWGEWKIAVNPWFYRYYKGPFLNRTLEVLTKTNEDVVVVHWYQKTESFNLVNKETMYITDIPVDFEKWRVFIK